MIAYKLINKKWQQIKISEFYLFNVLEDTRYSNYKIIADDNSYYYELNTCNHGIFHVYDVNFSYYVWYWLDRELL